MIIALIVLLLFFFLSIYLSLGKGEYLIAGFNTMSKEEQDKYDKVAMCQFMGKMMFVYTVGIALWIIGEVFNITYLFHVGTILFIFTTLFLIIYMNTGERFLKK